ncbi:MAG: hypothetical protein VX181_09715 [Pseudomonadota bacterium]|jgi:hypothetical protein|nr:hypothetical protein [Pseudomonadota bacterium]
MSVKAIRRGLSNSPKPISGATAAQHAATTLSKCADAGNRSPSGRRQTDYFIQHTPACCGTDRTIRAAKSIQKPTKACLGAFWGRLSENLE